MRSILVALVLIVGLILSLPVLGVSLIIGLFDRHSKVVFSQKVVKLMFRLVFFASATKVTVLGLENVPKDRAVLFAGNHRSYSDIPIVYTTTPVLVGFIAKKQINKIPIMNWWMHTVNCLFLDRDDLRQGLKTILGAIDNVKNGYSMFVMPEGTRNHTDELLPFKEGSFKIAEKTGCPIVPVSITNSDGIYELHMPWIRRQKVLIHYGTPIYVDQLPKEEKKFLGVKVRGVITEMLAEDKKALAGLKKAKR